MIIDLHSHYFPLDIIDRFPDDVARVTQTAQDTYELVVAGHAFKLDRRLFDIDQQLADMRTQGMDGRTIMIPPFTFLYELSADIGVAWAQAINDGIAATAGRYPHELHGFATVPLQDIVAAVEELERAIRELGLKGVEIATSIAGTPLDDVALDPFWQRCEALRVPVLIHPHYVSGADRMGEYHLRNLIGNPSETSLAGARLLFGGVLERFPDLRLVLSHGGGALPHLIGRLRQGFSVRPECQIRASDPIGDLAKLFYDTIVFDGGTLRHISDVVGASQLALGTDYPFDMSEADPVTFVRESGLSDADAAIVLRTGEQLISSVRTKIPAENLSAES